MLYSAHTCRLLHDADLALTKYLYEELSERELQNNIEAVGRAIEEPEATDIKNSLLMLVERIEYIYFMEFPKNRRKLIVKEVESIREIIQL